MSRLIDADALYERACELEAQALSYVGKIVNDETRTEEWRIWSAVLAERTAFKHDIFDAPEVKPEPKWIPVSERLPEVGKEVLRTIKAYGWNGEEYRVVNIGIYDTNFGNIIAWMPLPEPYRGEGEVIDER